MARRGEISAGLLAYRRRPALQFLLAHPGGPFWAKKDDGAWTIPKGLIGHDDLLDGARREFEEETGFVAKGPFTPLKPVRQKSGKTVHAFAFEAEFDPAAFVSNTFEMEWPPKSGKKAAFPEVDRAAWFGLDEARRRIQPGQVPILEELVHRLVAARP